MTGLLIARNSMEHFAEVAKIDNYFNEQVGKARKIFKVRHPRVDPQESPEWIGILTEIEGRRMAEFKSLRDRIIDPPR